jgi:UDPglucose 6-dehydrogenase
MTDGAKLCIYDPQVDEDQIRLDLATPKFEWDHPSPKALPIAKDAISVVNDPYEAAHGAHALCLLTEWDAFKAYDYQKIYDSMVKPAFIFDGRNVLDHPKLREIGFVVYALGKPLDPFLQNHYS